MKAILLLIFFPISLLAKSAQKASDREKSIACDEKVPKVVRVMQMFPTEIGLINFWQSTAASSKRAFTSGFGGMPRPGTPELSLLR